MWFINENYKHIREYTNNEMTREKIRISKLYGKSEMVFIPFNIPSSKNSKVATSRGVFHSKTVGKFLRDIGVQHYSVSKKEITYYKTKPCLFPVTELKKLFLGADKPSIVGIHFVRQTKSKFDFHNICQIIFDLLVAFDIIEDDNMDCVLPFPLEIDDKWYSVDKNNPGAWVTVL